MAAIIVPGFVEGKWADQEIGIAIGRGKLVVPIMKDAIPHGFIGKFLALNGRGKTVSKVAEAMFKILARSDRSRSRMLICLVDAASQESTPEAVMAN
jgi:hypothetical protein